MTWVPALAKKIESTRGKARKYAVRQKYEGLPETMSRTKLRHQIASQESRASENRGNLPGDRAPSGRTVLDGWLLAGVIASHDVMVASLTERLCLRFREIWQEV